MRFFLMFMLLAVVWHPIDSAATVGWEVKDSWQTAAPPIDVAYSQNGKWVFILTDRDEVLIYSAKGKLEGEIPVDSSVTAIGISPKGDQLLLISKAGKSVKRVSVEFVVAINVEGSPFMGAADAPVVIAVFSDFQ